jgi:homoserine O-acetyltransferase/O-succinyltransferase
VSPALSADAPDARQYCALPDPFPLKRGGTLAGARLAYETWGSLNAARDNVVLVYTGMSPSAHAASNIDPSPGWWEDMIGPGKPIDTQRWFVICANSLGSCRGSTGPASLDARSGTPYRMRFPELSVEDIAQANHYLLTHLQINKVRVAVGCSMGGMSALAHAVLRPHSAEHAILISTAARAEPLAIAIRSLQRQMVMADPKFADGNYQSAAEVDGMGLARKLGVISYRSGEEWRVRFSRQKIAQRTRHEAFAPEFEVERYLEGHAERWRGSFDPCSYIYLSRAMDWFDLSEHGLTIDDAYARLGYKSALVLGVQTDILFPLHQQKEIATGLRCGGCKVDFQALPSIQGHDAFLVDMESFGPAVAHYLAELPLGTC